MRNIGVALILVFVCSVGAMAANPRVVSSSKVKPRIRVGNKLTIMDPFKDLAEWAKKPNDSHAYHIDFTATSMDRNGLSTFFEGRMSCPSTNKGIVHTLNSAVRYFSDKRYKMPGASGMAPADKPFDPKRTDKVYVKLSFANKLVTIVKSPTIISIPLKAENGVFHGYAASGPKRARYTFSFRKGKQYIVK